MNYRTYISKLHFSSEIKELSKAFLYGTRYDLFTEYQSEASSARLYVRRFMSFEDQIEIEFYILMDYLTFIPFGNLGRQWLAEQKVDIVSLKYEYSLLILESEGINLSVEELYKLKLFFENYDNGVQPITPVGYANIVRKISDRLFNMIFIGECAGSIGKGKLLTFYLKQIAQEIYDSELKRFDVADFLNAFPDIQSLNETQIGYIKDVLYAYR